MLNKPKKQAKNEVREVLPETPKDKLKALEKAKAELAQMYGKPVVKSASDIVLERVSTGIISVDMLYGGEGLVKGRWNMIFGGKSSGKTTLSLCITAEVQRRGGVAGYIDNEHSFDPDWATKLGVDVSKLLYMQPATFEESLTCIRKLAPVVDYLVLDSIVAIAPEAESERTMEQDTMALIPRKLSQFFRITTPILGISKAVTLLINQTRIDLGAYVPMERYPGGEALAHNCSTIIHLRRGSSKDDPRTIIDGKEVVIGKRIYTRVDKTKTSSTEGMKSFFDLLNDSPFIDRYTDLMNVAEIKNLITHAGAWYYCGEQKFQGSKEVIEALKSDNKFYEMLLEKVLHGTRDITQGETNDGSKTETQQR
jgi:recombination protein RecA